MSDFDRILSSTPLNATAARQLSKGEHYENKKNTQKTWLGCPPLRNMTQYKHQPQFVDLTGEKFGRLTVLGLLEDPERSKNAAGHWVCRCLCGSYVGFKAKPLREGVHDRCCECRNTKDLRERPPLWKELADGKSPKVGRSR